MRQPGFHSNQSGKLCPFNMNFKTDLKMEEMEQMQARVGGAKWIKQKGKWGGDVPSGSWLNSAYKVYKEDKKKKGWRAVRLKQGWISNGFI